MIVPLLIVALLLLGQVWVAHILRGIFALILATQAIFWALSFVVRPVYLEIVQPTSDLFLRDRRLLWLGYDAGLSSALWIVAAGQAMYLLVMLAWSPYIRSRHAVPTLTGESSGLANLVPAASVLYTLGWVGRITTLIYPISLDSFLRPLGLVGGVLLILVASGARSASAPPLVIAVVVLEAGWSLIYASKTALIVPLIALMARWILAGQGQTIRRRALILVLVGVAGFVAVQPLKGVNTAENISTSGTSSAGVGLAIAVLERFDGVSAVLDAEGARSFSGWLSPSQFAGRALTVVTPLASGSDDTSVGEEWAQEVRSQSIPNQFGGVSLAAGPTAEGYAVGGFAGVLIENALMGTATVALCLLLSWRRPVLFAAAAYVVFSTVLFEQGLLGLFASFNKAFQVALITYVCLILLGRRQRLKGSTPPGRVIDLEFRTGLRGEKPL